LRGLWMRCTYFLRNWT